MGKNKSQKKRTNKDASVFKLAGANVVKSKLKTAKPVKTNLKKLKHHMRNKQEGVDSEFKDMFPAVVMTDKAKRSTSENMVKSSKDAAAHHTPADMKEVAELFEKL